MHFLKTATIIPMLKPFNETLRLIIYDFDYLLVNEEHNSTDS